MPAPRITLEQWRALQSVVESGGYAAAAEALHKSQSTVSYAVQKIERMLGLRVFEIRGRKARLTQQGEVLYRRAKGLLDEAAVLERGASEMAKDWQPEIGIAVDGLYPTWMLLECLGEFAAERPETRIEVYETVMTGTAQLLAERKVDLAIGSQPAGHAASGPLLAMRRLAVAHPDHPLHHLGRPVTARDLRRHRRIFIRDTSSNRQREVEGVELRWTVGNKATSIRAVVMGLGFAWMPEEWIVDELRDGSLKPIALKEPAERTVELYLSIADADFPSRDVSRLAEIIRRRTAEACRTQARRKGTRARGSRVRHPR